MTEKKLYERLIEYKKKYGLTQENFQQYQWALDLLRQQAQNKNSAQNESA